MAQGRKIPSLLSDLEACVKNVLANHGFGRDQARQVAKETAAAIQRSWGGLMVYVPIARIAFELKRDENIIHEFNGRNASQLARKHRVSVQTVYRVLRRNKAGS